MKEKGRIMLKYSAKSVNIVASGNAELSITLDGKPINEKDYGTDLSNGLIRIDEQRLYNIIKSSSYGKHTLEIDIKGKGFQLYTFTFG